MQARIENFRGWIKTADERFLKMEMPAMLERANFEVLEFVEHAFEPYGYTAIWLLAESHLAVHTFPEQGKAYIELSSCNAEKQAQFVKDLAARFGYLLEG